MKARLSAHAQAKNAARLVQRLVGYEAGSKEMRFSDAGFSIIKPPRRAQAAKQTEWAIEVIHRWKKAREVGVLAIYPDEEISCKSRAERGISFAMDTAETKANALKARAIRPRLKTPRVRVPREGNGKVGKAYHHDSIYDVEKRRALVRKMQGQV